MLSEDFLFWWNFKNTSKYRKKNYSVFHRCTRHPSFCSVTYAKPTIGPLCTFLLSLQVGGQTFLNYGEHRHYCWTCYLHPRFWLGTKFGVGHHWCRRNGCTLRESRIYHRTWSYSPNAVCLVSCPGICWNFLQLSEHPSLFPWKSRNYWRSICIIKYLFLGMEYCGRIYCFSGHCLWTDSPSRLLQHPSL